MQGFFEPVLQRIPLENLRNRLRRSIVRRMRGTSETEADTWVDAQERWEIEGVDEHAISLDKPQSRRRRNSIDGILKMFDATQICVAQI